MTDVRIDRVKSDVFGTFGRLRTSGGFGAISIECPWLGNRRSVSCVPPGVYDVEWTDSPRFGRPMYVLTGVPDRSGIRMHPGNLAGDVDAGLISHFAGCIGLGARVGMLGRQRAVLVSAPTLIAFEDHMGRKPFSLEIH